MKLVIAGTGASGAIYLQRLLGKIDARQHEVHLILSTFAKQVIHEEIGELRVPGGVHQHGDRTMNVPFVSGSARFDAMVICPCSMGTLASVAAGTSRSLVERAADVTLKERRPLVVVPRETPLSAIDRLERAAMAELASVERMRTYLGKAPMSAREATRTARTLATLTDTLSKLQRIRAVIGGEDGSWPVTRPGSTS